MDHRGSSRSRTEIIDQLYLTTKLLNITLFHLHPLFYDKGSVSIWRYFDSIPSFLPLCPGICFLCILFLPHYGQANTLFLDKESCCQSGSPWLYIVLFATAFSGLGLPGGSVGLSWGRAWEERRLEGVWVMRCLVLQAAITWPNCLLDCCVAAPGEATMPCLFVYERLWLWLAASFSAAEHTIGTKGWEKKILLQFPIGKHSLSSLEIQQWGTDG